MKEFRYNFNQPNKSKIVTATAIAFLVVILIFSYVITHPKPKKAEPKTAEYTETNPSSVFTDYSKTIQIELSNIYGFGQYKPKNETHLIELRTNNDVNIYISKIAKVEGKNLLSVANADKKSFTESFSKTSNISTVKETVIGGKNIATYSFHYLDEPYKKAFYIQVAVLEYSNCFYIMDIEFPQDNISSYANLVKDAISSFKEL